MTSKRQDGISHLNRCIFGMIYSMSEQDFNWAPRIKPALLRRLYEADARQTADPELVEEVGYTLWARCETIYRVTERRCPRCAEHLDGAWDGDQRDRILTCPTCRWTSTWEEYHRSYKRDRIHGGRAYDFFIEYMHKYPQCTTPQQKMLQIDRLIHAVHESANQLWTLPAAVNLIQGKMEEVILFLDELAYGSQVPSERKQLREQYLKKMEASLEPNRRHAEEVARRRQEQLDAKPDNL